MIFGYLFIENCTTTWFIPEQECIPVRCVPPASVAIRDGGVLHQCILGYTTPSGCGPGDPPMCGPWDPPWPDPSASPSGCGPGDPPMQGMLGYHLQGMLGYHSPLDTCKACWDTTCNACWDTTPPNRILDTRF